jgi:hypothetical protein
MNDQAAIDAWNAKCCEVGNAMIQFIEPYTASISLEESPTSGRLVGSGTYLALQDRPYILTNEHVARYRLQGSLGHILKKEEYAFRIIHPFQCLTAPTDAAIARIDAEHFGGGDRKAVQPAQIADRYAPATHELLMIHGFPGERSRMITLLGGLISRSVPYVTQEMPLPSQYDPQLFFAIHYPFDTQLLRFDGTRACLPNPHGMSGSAVWATNYVRKNEQGWTPADAQIVGLIFAWDQKHHALIGVRIEIVRQFLVHALRREAAYFRWLQRGQPDGDDWRDWHWAVTEITDITCRKGG